MSISRAKGLNKVPNLAHSSEFSVWEAVSSTTPEQAMEDKWGSRGIALLLP